MSKKKDSSYSLVRAIFLIHSPDLVRDDLERLREQPEVLAACAKLRRELRRQSGIERNIEPPMGAVGSYQIDCYWKSTGQIDVLTRSDDPRIQWHDGFVEQVERIRRNALLPNPQLAADLGIDQKALALHSAFAAIHKQGLTVYLLFPESSRREALDLASVTEVSVLKPSKRRDPYVDGILQAVGADDVEGVMIYVRGVSKPIYLQNANDDELHALRKRGTRVRGILMKVNGVDFLQDPRFISLERQSEIPIGKALPVPA